MSHFSHNMLFDADPARVFAVLTNPDFLEDYAQAVGARDWRVRADPAAQHTVTDVMLTVPTSGIPGVFRRFVGASVEVTERREWDDGSSGEYTAPWTVHAVLGGRDSFLRGQLTLGTHAEGAQLSSHAAVEVHLGPLSKPAAGRIAELVRSALDNQARVAGRWLKQQLP